MPEQILTTGYVVTEWIRGAKCTTYTVGDNVSSRRRAGLGEVGTVGGTRVRGRAGWGRAGTGTGTGTLSPQKRENPTHRGVGDGWGGLGLLPIEANSMGRRRTNAN